MKILRAEHLGMCFGVRDAIALALEQADEQPLTILGDLVHNETVLAGLRERGIQIVPGPQSSLSARHRQESAVRVFDAGARAGGSHRRHRGMDKKISRV